MIRRHKIYYFISHRLAFTNLIIGQHQLQLLSLTQLPSLIHRRSTCCCCWGGNNGTK